MKNEYLILRMTAVDMYDNQFLMRGFNRKRMDQVIGVIAVVDHSENMYHLSRINVNLLQSDTQQNWAKLTWSSVDRKTLEQGLNRLPDELSNVVRSMRNNRMYHKVVTTIPTAFRDCHTEFVYSPSMPSDSVVSEKAVTLADFTVEDIIAHLKTRISGVTITF